MSSEYTLTIHKAVGRAGDFMLGVYGPDMDHRLRGERQNDQRGLLLHLVAETVDPSQPMRTEDPAGTGTKNAWADDVGRQDILLPSRAAAKRVVSFFQELQSNPERLEASNQSLAGLVQGALTAAGVSEQSTGSASTKGLDDEHDLGPKADDRKNEQNGFGHRAGRKEPEAVGKDDENPAPWDESFWEGGPSPWGDAPVKDGEHDTILLWDDESEADVSVDDEIRRAGHVTAAGRENPVPRSGHAGPDGQPKPKTRVKPIDEVRALLDEARRPIPGIDAAMEKHPSTWTKAELLAVQASDRYGRPNPDQTETAGAVSDWYQRVFGDGPLQYDDTGRMVEAEPMMDPPKTPVVTRDVNGRSVDAGMDRVARHLASASKADGSVKNAVLSAQRAYNMMQPMRPIKEDGQFGPKSKMALRESIRKAGAKRVEEGLSLGRFATYIERVRQKGDAVGLAAETERTFGPLFHPRRRRGADWAKATSPRPHMPEFTRPEARALQETINDFGWEIFGRNFQPVPEDGWIGPRTTEVFHGIAMSKAPEDLVKRYGMNLGFLSEDDL